MSRTGSIKRDNRGRWYFVVDIGPVSGPRKQIRRRGFRTKRDAQHALDALKADVQHGSFIETSRVRVGEFFEQWLEGLAVEGLEPNTVASYRTNVTAHIIPRLGGVVLQALTPGQVKAFYAELLANGRRDGKGGLAPRTVEYVATIFQKGLDEAVRHHLIAANPARDVRKPRRRQAGSKIERWDTAELRAFLDSISEERLYPAFLTLATTGLRRSELLGLRWEDADLEHGRVTVRQTLVLVDHQPRFKETPKSSKSRRTISLYPETVASLRSWRKHQLEERMVWKSAYHESGLVFTAEDGTALHPEHFSRQFARHVRHAGLRRIPLKGLRHSHATQLLAEGVDIRVVSGRLGHSSISVTADIYAAFTEAMDRDAAAVGSAALFG